MNRSFALFFCTLLLITYTRIECRAISKKSKISSMFHTNNTSYDDVTIENDNSNFHDYMILMNSTKFLQSKKATTIQLVTDEAEYYEWAEKWPRFLYDGIMTPRGLQHNPSMLDGEYLYFYEIDEKSPNNHVKRDMGYQKENESKLNIKGWEPIITDIENLKSKETLEFTPYNTIANSYYETESDASLNQDTNFNVTLDSLDIPKEEIEAEYNNINFEEVSPPWVRYGPMQLRNEMGQRINIYNVSDRNTSEYLRFPLARDRWWWEYEKHYMHWYFWHCQHWMTYWLIDPPVSPNPLVTHNHTKDKKSDFQDDENYRKNRAYYFFNYCNWLLPSNQTNLKNITEKLETFIGDKSVDGTKKRQATDDPWRTTPKIMKPHLRQPPPPHVHVGSCYHCGRAHVERTPVLRLCHRAFTDYRYFKFRKWLTSVCLNTPGNENSMLHRSELLKNGSIFLYGRYYFNQCSHQYLDLGGLYTERSCRKVYFYKYFSSQHIQNVYDALDETLGKDTVEGCVSTPYAFFAPFSRSKPGLFTRAYSCICTGEYCNLSNRQQFFIWLPYFVLFLFCF